MNRNYKKVQLENLILLLVIFNGCVILDLKKLYSN